MDANFKQITPSANKLLLFGGVYSNLQALEALIAEAEKQHIRPDHCICTGDIIGYCAQPEETLTRFNEWGAHSICGNVEIQLRTNETHCGCDFKSDSRCDTFSQTWYPYAQSKLSKNSIDYLNSLPEFIQFKFANKTVTVVHGSFFNTSEFIFKSTAWQSKQATFTATNSDVIIAGHSGIPFSDKKDGLLWINPGVIGMPANNGSPDVWYAILENNQNALSLTFKTLSYNYTLAQQLMKTTTLPQAYANTLSSGIWDNTEILPKIEAEQQGLSLHF